MCNRYVLVSKSHLLEKELQAEFISTYQPTFNSFPGSEMPIILSNDALHIQSAKWGLVPFWSKWTEMNYFYSAFTTDLVKHPAYRVPIRKYRCLVPANCFYIWADQKGKRKCPYVVYIKDQRILTFAGVYDLWRDKVNNEIILSFAIISTYSNKRLAKIHPTMPVIIPPSRRRKYLKNNLPLNDVMRLLRPFETDQMNLYPVSLKIKDPSINCKELVQPLGEKIYREH